MIKNKYFEKLFSAAVFFSAHFRIIVFMSFLVFLFYVAMLGIDIVSAINHIPGTEDINKKMLSVNIRRDILKKIDNFILMRQKETSGRIFKKNPFLPYQKGVDAFSGSEPTISPEIPSPSPALSPYVSATPGPEFIQ